MARGAGGLVVLRLRGDRPHPVRRLPHQGRCRGRLALRHGLRLHARLGAHGAGAHRLAAGAAACRADPDPGARADRGPLAPAAAPFGRWLRGSRDRPRGRRAGAGFRDMGRRAGAGGDASARPWAGAVRSARTGSDRRRSAGGRGGSPRGRDRPVETRAAAARRGRGLAGLRRNLRRAAVFAARPDHARQRRRPRSRMGIPHGRHAQRGGRGQVLAREHAAQGGRPDIRLLGHGHRHRARSRHGWRTLALRSGRLGRRHPLWRDLPRCRLLRGSRCGSRRSLRHAHPLGHPRRPPPRRRRL